MFLAVLFSDTPMAPTSPSQCTPADQWRGRGADGPWQRRSQVPVLAKMTTGEWHRHDVPDRAPLRHRSRPHQDPGGPSGRRLLRHHRPAKSSSPPASTTSPTTSSTWCWLESGCSCGRERDLASSSRRNSGQVRRWCRRAQRRHVRADREQKWAFTPTRRPCRIPRRHRPAVGEEHRGLPAMFVMMNGARPRVAVQGLGVSEVAYQNAAAYAKERRQGRSLKGPVEPDKPADFAAADPTPPHAAEGAPSMKERERSWSDRPHSGRGPPRPGRQGGGRLPTTGSAR